jgi:cytochrome c5
MTLKVDFKFTRRPVAVLVVTLALAACGGGALLMASPADLQRGAARYPDLTAAQLDDGRSLYAGHCSACHLPPAPASQPASAWPGHVAEMKVRARLSEDQARLVERYLVTMALRAGDGPTVASGG